MSSWWSITKRLWRLRKRPVVARRRGALFLLSPQDFIDLRLLAGQPYENAQLARARLFIEERRISRVIDIGANFGLYSIVLGKLPFVDEVIAIEPVGATFHKLLGNVYLNGLSHKVVAHRLALSNREGVAALHVDPRASGMSRFDLSGIGEKATLFQFTEQVRLARFDDIVQAHDKRSFVKIDVEGHAREVLEGMSGFLGNADAVIQIEAFAGDRDSVSAHMERNGFRLVDRIDDDYYYARS